MCALCTVHPLLHASADLRHILFSGLGRKEECWANLTFQNHKTYHLRLAAYTMLIHNSA